MKRRIVGFVLAAVVALGVISIITTMGLTHLGTVRVTSVQTDAMAPSIKSGALVLSTRTAIKDVKADDIISIRTESGNRQDVLGRVKTIKSDAENDSIYEYTLQSDANLLPNTYTYKNEGDTYRLLVSVPLVGYAVQGVKDPLPATIFLAAMVLLVVLYLRFLHAPASEATQKAKADKRAADNYTAQNYGGVDDMLALFEPEVATN